MPGRQHKNYVRNWETATHMHSNVFLLCSLRFSSSVWAAWHTHTHEAKRRMIGERRVQERSNSRRWTKDVYIHSFRSNAAHPIGLRFRSVQRTLHLLFVTSKRRFHDGMLDRNEGIYIFGWWAYATKKPYKWPQYVRTYFMHDALSLRSPVRSLKGLSEWLCPNKPNIFMYKYKNVQHTHSLIWKMQE